MFCDFLLECAHIEKTIDLHRQFLTKLESYYPYEAYKLLSIKDITPSSLQVFMHSQGFLKTVKEVSLIFYKPSFTYPDFLRYILPTDQKLRDFICSQQPQTLSNDVKYQLAKLFDQDITLTSNLRSCVCPLQKGTPQMIEQYFRSQNVFAYQNEIELIMRRLDFYGDGEIDIDLLNEWMKGLQKEPKYTTPNKSNIKSLYTSPQTKPKSPILITDMHTSFSQQELKTKYTSENVKRQIKFSSPSQCTPKSQSTTKKQIQQNLIESTEKKYDKSKLRYQMAMQKEKVKSPQKDPKVIKPVSALKKVLKNNFTDTLQFMMDNAIKIESLKQSLTVQKEFNAYDVFKSMDYELKGMINNIQFDAFTNQKQGSSKWLFKKYKNQSMQFYDFLNLIKPQTQSYADILINRLPVSESLKLNLNDIFTQKTLEILYELLDLLSKEIKLNGTRQLFNQIDSLTKDGIIGVSDLQQYLYQLGLRYEHSEVQLLMNQHDQDGDGRWCLSEFLQI